MNAICVAIRSNGENCTIKRKAVGDGTRCGVHYNSLVTHGPNTMALLELKYVSDRTLRELTARYNQDLAHRQLHENRVELYNAYRADMRRIRQAYIHDHRMLKHAHDVEFLRTGVDPDEQANHRRQQVAENRRRLADARRERRLVAQERMIQERREMDHEPPPRRELARFAADPQNVHTAETVRQTKEIVERVRTIPVPEGYRWNKVFVSKTIGEIIADCQLTSHSAAQMFNQYVSSVAIYDIEEGIYGKVLDSVWQYVKQSPDKQDLCNILRNEMRDNIGMCAQGNLSRICNILAGYMEGIGSQESVSERLGRLLPPLMEIEDVDTRVRNAFNILQENAVPISDWDTWINPLIYEDDMVIDVEYIKHNMYL
jgi:hypothetical protein